MKRLSKFALLVVLASCSFLASCSGDYYVANRPSEPTYIRPRRPYNGAVWVDGDWRRDKGRYSYRDGYWSRPRRGHNYVRGSWTHTGRGYTWRRGRWR